MKLAKIGQGDSYLLFLSENKYTLVYSQMLNEWFQSIKMNVGVVLLAPNDEIETILL